MASDDREFAHESLQDRETIVKYLGAIAEGLEKGRLLLATNGEQFALETPVLLRFDVQAKQKRDRAQLMLRLSWKNRKQGAKLRVEPLTIDAQAPER
jgi:amphi-Trp domain-containing protein